MNRDDYRAAFDAVKFSEDFEAETIRKLTDAQPQLEEKERNTMQISQFKRAAVLTAAAVAVLALSVSAALLWLSPAQTAERIGDQKLAEAFRSAGAIAIDDTRQVDAYTVTLAGMVSGENLSDFESTQDGTLMVDRTYAVFSIANADGTPLEDFPNLTYTPLVSNYHVSAVNAWTLDGGCTSFLDNGVCYYLFDTRNIEMFADHTVYFAIYEGGVPSLDTFAMDMDGAISLREGVNGTLFVLPLDPAKADPDAAKAFVDGTGLDFLPMNGLDPEDLPDSPDAAVVLVEDPDGASYNLT